ncbi:Guanine nucleotide-binding-like protein 1 [Chamberlinius hualienensis]
MSQTRRKVPFSGKQKKLQLKLKKDRKVEGGELPSSHRPVESHDTIPKKSSSRYGNRVKQPKQSLSFQSADYSSSNRSNFDPNRYRLKFYKETKEELERRKKMSYEIIVPKTAETLEVDADDVFLPGSELDMPKRPPWNYSMSTHQLNDVEDRYFRDYLLALENKFPLKELSYFELNLETWRQLWRVLEMSDIVFIVVDIRFPPLLFPPALYNHVAQELKKSVVLILNKIDLATPSLVVAWKHYFQNKFPHLHVICFTSMSSCEVKSHDSEKKMQQKKPRGRLRMAAEGALRVMEECDQIVGGKVDLKSWRGKIEAEMKDEDWDDTESSSQVPVTVNEVDTTCQPYERYQNNILTIGFIGQPNVGKSSIINSLMGKKVVSVSRTPGHTKHFQTIFITDNVRLCDCPGLVFPSKVDKPLQVLAGSYPIAQLQEPYTSVRLLAQHIPIQKLLKLRHPEAEGNVVMDFEWSALDICEAYAELKGFKTARAARNDAYRAANSILRMALDGTFCLCLRPPGYSQQIETWSSHPDIGEIEKIILRKKHLTEEEAVGELYSSSNERSSENVSEEDSEESSEDEFVGQNKFALLSSKD